MIDGEHIVEKFDVMATPPYRGHTWSYVPGTGVHTVTVKQSIFRPQPGSCGAKVSLWQSLGNNVYKDFWLDKPVTVSGSPWPFVQPTVVTNQATLGRVIRTLFNTNPMHSLE